MSHHIIQFKDVSYRYSNERYALDNINITIHHGESVGIIGSNGAGKSTLLMLLLGLIFPISGEIRVGDFPVTQKILPYIRERVGYCFQNPDEQLFMNTVFDDVAFAPRNYGLDEKEVEIRVNKSLETVGGLHLKNRFTYKLSGGEKRAVAIATVIAMEPDILVMDEPSSELDPGARRRLINLLKNFKHTKIIATHDLDMVLDLCERTILIRDGKIVFDGLTNDILTNKQMLENSGLELPLSLQRT